ALADLLTIRRQLGDEAGRSVAYVGDANNVARSLALGAGLRGMDVRVAAPEGYGSSESDHARFAAAGVEPRCATDPREAGAGADVVYTDVWASMGQEGEVAPRRRDFAGFT